MPIEINPQFQDALDRMEEGKQSLFITGRAGTGKSTLLEYFRDHTNRNTVILAPTGVAAVNVGGATIHSFFGFKPDITPEKAWKKGARPRDPDLYINLDIVIIDEISMVRADLLDSIDAFLRRVMGNTMPFGGKQLIMFGDLYQLPPVVSRAEQEIFRTHYDSPFFFSSEVMTRLDFHYLELTKIYRQSDPAFIEILNAVRSRTITDAHLVTLNARLHPEYLPPAAEYTVHLTGTNRASSVYNAVMLEELDDIEQTFHASSSGDFPRRTEPASADLTLKIGAQVMCTHNDPRGKYINGTVGRVKEIGRTDEGKPMVTVTLQTGDTVQISEYTWEMYEFSYSKIKHRINSKTVGTYTQIPLILAWSITIHKSQGKTFDKVVIDLPTSFAHGQTYVALSRATTLGGIILKRPLSKRHVLMDYAVTRWLTGLKYGLAHSKQSVQEIRTVIEQAITNETQVQINYLKGSDVASTRTILPSTITKQSFKGHEFIGVNAYDELRRDYRVFRLDRILSAKLV
jgi:ATP-dependent DNA helicase PIF1